MAFRQRLRPIKYSFKRKQLETIRASIAGSTTMVTNMSSFKITRFPRRRSNLGD